MFQTRVGLFRICRQANRTRTCGRASLLRVSTPLSDSRVRIRAPRVGVVTSAVATRRSRWRIATAESHLAASRGRSCPPFFCNVVTGALPRSSRPIVAADARRATPIVTRTRCGVQDEPHRRPPPTREKSCAREGLSAMPETASLPCRPRAVSASRNGAARARHGGSHCRPACDSSASMRAPLMQLARTPLRRRSCTEGRPCAPPVSSEVAKKYLKRQPNFPRADWPRRRGIIAREPESGLVAALGPATCATLRGPRAQAMAVRRSARKFPRRDAHSIVSPRSFGVSAHIVGTSRVAIASAARSDDRAAKNSGARIATRTPRCRRRIRFSPRVARDSRVGDSDSRCESMTNLARAVLTRACELARC